MRRVFSKQVWAAGGAVRRVALTGLGMVAGALGAAPPTVSYNFGNPTADEQYMLELINRARAHPGNEGAFLAGMSVSDADVKRAVDLYSPTQPWVRPDNVRTDFGTYAAQPPIAWNAKLQASARAHAQDMAARNYQGHSFPPSQDAGVNQQAIIARIEGVYGYDWQTFAENVYASQDVSGGYARVPSTNFGHCGLQIDWTVPTLFHRNAIMSRAPYGIFKEIGIGVVVTPRSTIAEPALAICQDFGIERFDVGGTGEARSNVPFLTGAAYADGDQNFFYAVGEGRGGITVMPEHGKYFAVTNAAGSYSLPLIDLPPNTTTLRVSFSGGALRETFTRDVVLSGTLNRKLDLRVPVDGASRLTNLSTRLRVEGGDAVGIAGFVVSGDRPKRVLIRSLGPTLQPFGIPNPLPDPNIRLQNALGQQIAANDNWSETQRQEIEATPFAPPNPLEPALIALLAPGSYTAIVSGTETAPAGVAIIEVYDLDSSSTDARAINVSTRGKVQTGNEVMIGGFVIDGTQDRLVVVRALGPTLANFGINNPLLDPSIELRRATPTGSELVRSNDNWREDAGQVTLTSKGLSPPDDREPAMVVILAPGSYTAIVRGKGETTGVGIVEVYDVP